MATIKEFYGIRPKKEFVEQVAELPYDVLSSAEAKEYAQNNPYSFFHISKPEVDLADNIDSYADEVYQKGADNYKALRKQNVLQQDQSPSLYLYTLVMDGRSQTGLVSCISIDDYVNNVVKKHELTREDKERDRSRHVDTINANTGPVFLLYKENEEGKSLFEKAMAIEPEVDFTAEDGIRHIFRVIDNVEMIAQFKAFLTTKDLYIADGHHRAASAVRVGLNRRNDKNINDGNEYNWFLGVIFPDTQLKIMAYNRVVRDLHGKTEEQFFEELSQKMTVEKTENPVPPTKYSYCLYLKNQWYLLKYKEEVTATGVEGLDCYLLQENVLAPMLGINDPRTDERIAFIGGIRGTEELERLVDNGQYALALSMYPTSTDDLMSVADHDEIMPPKSTWFEPKLRSGMILHNLD